MNPGLMPATTSPEAAALEKLVHLVAKRDESAAVEKGKLGSIGRLQELWVLIARACGVTTVSLARDVVGKEGVQALKSAGENARTKLRQIGFPCNITNVIAYAAMAGEWGGRDHLSIPEYGVGAANFVKTDEEEFDAWRPPKDNKIEARPRHAQQMGQWYRDAIRECWAWACLYGEEWYPEQAKAALTLMELHEKHKHEWPPNIVFGTWAELRWA